MKPSKINNSQNNLFKNRLSNQLNPRHELFILASKLPWALLEEEFADLRK
jgi:IS5 family transposase